MVFASYAVSAMGCGSIPGADNIADLIDNFMDTGILMTWGAIADVKCPATTQDPLAIFFVPFKVGCCTLFEYPGVRA